MGVFSQKVLQSAQGKTCLYTVGQAGFIVKSASGKLLGIDLYLSDCVERDEGHMGFKRLLPKILNPDEIVFDVLICTHPHLDHFDVDSVPQLMGNNKTRLFCSVNCEKLVRECGLSDKNERIKYVRPGDEFESEGFNLRFVNCDHGTGAPDAVGVVVTVDGKTVYEAGDTCLRLDRISEIPKGLDVLIAPINGAYGNLNEEECVELAKALQPRLTIPCHYGMFASHHGDVGKFYELITAHNLPFLLMSQGEQLIIQE